MVLVADDQAAKAEARLRRIKRQARRERRREQLEGQGPGAGMGSRLLPRGLRSHHASFNDLAGQAAASSDIHSNGLSLRKGLVRERRSPSVASVATDIGEKAASNLEGGRRFVGTADGALNPSFHHASLAGVSATAAAAAAKKGHPET